MRLLFFTILFSAFVGQAHAIDLATCGPLNGYSFSIKGGLHTKDRDTGWGNEKIPNGKTQLVKTNDGYDLLFLDSLDAITSVKANGGQIALFHHMGKDFSIIVFHSKEVQEVYRFFEDANGDKKFSLYSQKGVTFMFPKAGLMVGDCSYINFNDVE